MTKKIMVTKVEIIDGEVSLLFPKGFMEALNLKDNQLLIWEIEDDKITIRTKVSNAKQQ